MRQANLKLWDALNDLVALQREWNAMDYGTTLDAGTQENTGILAADVGAVVFDTTNAFVTVLGQGHATNMAKLL